MGYEYIQTTEVKGVTAEKVADEISKLMQLRCVNKIVVKHVGGWIYDISCENEEHGVTY
jgi:hypothetical protein